MGKAVTVKGKRIVAVDDDFELPQFDNYIMFRNGLKEHFRRRGMSPMDWCVYSTLHFWADWATGVYFGTAKNISDAWDGEIKEATVRDCLDRLRKRKYINYRKGDGRRGSFSILINKYEPTVGRMRGYRLSAFASKDLDHPVYESKTGSTAGEPHDDRMTTAGGSPDDRTSVAAESQVGRTLQELQDVQNVQNLQDVQDVQHVQSASMACALDSSITHCGSNQALVFPETGCNPDSESEPGKESDMPLDLTPPANFNFWPEEEKAKFRAWQAEQREYMKQNPSATLPSRPKPTCTAKAKPVQSASQTTTMSEPVQTSTPATTSAPVSNLKDIRDWSEERFGVSGERLRNCIIYQLDHSPNDWYRTQAVITPRKMESEKFVLKLDADTPVGWTPTSAELTKRLANINISQLPEYKKPKYGLTARYKNMNRNQQ